MDKYDGDVDKFIEENARQPDNIKLAIREQFNIFDKMMSLSKQGKVPMCVDLKPGNFVYRIREGRLEIKMIDFGSDFCFDDIDLAFLEGVTLDDIAYITLLSNIIKHSLERYLDKDTITNILGATNIHIDYIKTFCSEKREIIKKLVNYYDNAIHINPKVSSLIWYFTGLQPGDKGIPTKLYDQYDEICSYFSFTVNTDDYKDINLQEILSNDTPETKNYVIQIYRHLSKCNILTKNIDILSQQKIELKKLIKEDINIQTRCFVLDNFLGIIIYYVGTIKNMIKIDKICIHHKYRKKNNVQLFRYIIKTFVEYTRDFNTYLKININAIREKGDILIKYGFIPKKYDAREENVQFITNREISMNSETEFDNRRHQLAHLLENTNRFNIILSSDLNSEINRLIREKNAKDRLFYLNLNNMYDNNMVIVSTIYDKPNVLGYPRATLQIGWRIWYKLNPFLHFLSHAKKYPQLLMHLWYQDKVGIIIISAKNEIPKTLSLQTMWTFIEEKLVNAGIVELDNSPKPMSVEDGLQPMSVDSPKFMSENNESQKYKDLEYELNEDNRIPINMDICDIELVQANVDCIINNIYIPRNNDNIISGINLMRIDKFRNA